MQTLYILSGKPDAPSTFTGFSQPDACPGKVALRWAWLSAQCVVPHRLARTATPPSHTVSEWIGFDGEVGDTAGGGLYLAAARAPS